MNGSDSIMRHIRNYYRSLYQEDRSDKLLQLPIKSGRRLAESMGYPCCIMDNVPEKYWAKFFPCGNPLPHISPSPGDLVLNLGCGAGFDSFFLHATHGNSVKIIAVDVVEEVVRAASVMSENLFGRSPSGGTPKLGWLCGCGESLPFHGDSFDWVLMNGVFNLFPDKPRLLAEIHRVIKPSGCLVCTDLCSSGQIPEYFKQEWDAWAWCMSGACTEQSLMRLLIGAGFHEVKMFRAENPDMFYRISFMCGVAL